jgi:hypothetical protein
MNSTLTPRVMILAASIAGLIACDSTKQVQQETQDLNETKQEVAKDQADMRRDQAQEQAELRKDEQRDTARDPALRPMDGTGVVEPGVNARADNRAQDRAQDMAEERADLAKDQAEERAKLNEKSADKIRDEKQDLAEAKKDANEQRGDLVQDSRDKLRQIDARAEELRTKVSSATPEDKAQVTTALTGFPTKRQALERDIEALGTVKEANLSRAKDKVEKQLSSLDKTLDKAESSL